MSEFTKLGGYLIEGQPEVVHDSALSGNGLEGSPLGLSEQVSEANDLVHSNSGTWNGVSTKLDTTATANFYTTANESGFITGVDLTPYQEKADMTAYATVESLTAKQDAGDYLSASDSANFLLTSDSGNFYPMNENPSGYLTAHQSLADYQLTADMTGYLTTTDSANFLTAVPAGTMNESAFGYDANDKISGYNGSAFAGGSEVPEGVMVESGLEYNAVNEISGYNGSAIAQYGAEKQWLVHDDTLVHAANSAQYALGVNVSAVQSLMGLDETVLFSGNLTGNGATAQLSEPITNFERIKVYGHTDDGLQCPWFTEFYPNENTLMDVGVATNNAGWGKWFNFTITTGGLYTNVTGRVLTFGTTTWNNITNWGTTKVIGIGRKS